MHTSLLPVVLFIQLGGVICWDLETKHVCLLFNKMEINGTLLAALNTPVGGMICISTLVVTCPCWGGMEKLVGELLFNWKIYTTFQQAKMLPMITKAQTTRLVYS